MEQAHINVVYDGEAVEDGEMDVAQLASSLLALGKLVETADAIVSGTPNRIRVRVKAEMKRGSFDVGIVLAVDSVWDAAKSFFGSPIGATATGIVTLLGFSAKDLGKGLIQGVRWLKGRRVAKKIVLEDGNTRIETYDGDSTVVPTPVAKIIDDPQVRQHLERFTEPLREDGVDSIRFELRGDEVSERISASEEDAFKATGGSDPTSSTVYEATYQIKRLYFEEGKKWRLSNGRQAIFAEIEDRDFWDKVGRSEIAFASNDYLHCLVRMDQWLGSAGLKTEYAVEKVLKHIPAPKQGELLG